MSQRKPEQTFHFGIWTYDIDKAIGILKRKPRAPVMVAVDELRSLMWMTRIDEEYAGTIDLSAAEPIILAPIKKKDGIFHMVIDGWHRIAKAVASGVKEIPAYVLTMPETKRIMS